MGPHSNHVPRWNEQREDSPGTNAHWLTSYQLRMKSVRGRYEKRFHHPDAGSEVLRRAGSSVEESGPSEYLRTGVLSE